MRPHNLARVLPFVLFVVAGLAGCLGDDATVPESSEDAARATATASTGSITGQIVTVDLEVLVNLPIGLTNRTGGIEQTNTDNQGRYTFNGLAPGQYRLQIADECCKVTTKNIAVAAGMVTEVNLRVERATSADLGRPFVASHEWQGFMSCGWSAVGPSHETCEPVDNNHDQTHDFEVKQGIEEMVIAMNWVPTSQGIGEEMRLQMTSRECRQCELYFRAQGPPPLIAPTINSNSAHISEYRFENINGTQPLRFDTAMAGLSVAYQQEFTVYWHEFHHQIAPSGFNPLPDG